MFTDIAMSHADACRFCWMCRHVCPVGLTSGKEGNTPRGKAIVVSMDSRNIPLGGEAAELMYECCLCEGCSNDCVTGYEPPMFIREARSRLVAEGLLPHHIQKLVDQALEGKFYDNEPNEELKKAIAQLPPKADVLFYIGGEGIHYSAQNAVDFMKVLKAVGIEFTALEQEPYTGTHLGDLIGYTDEVRRESEACAKQMINTGAKTIVVLDPSDARFIKQQWNEWGIDIEAEVLTATSYAVQLFKEGKLKLKKLTHEKVTYHDPCRLARALEETEAARRLIEAMGIHILEMSTNKKLTKCCSGSVFSEVAPKMSKELVNARWKDAADAGANKMITSCPACHHILGGSVPDGYTILDIYSLLAQASA